MVKLRIVERHDLLSVEEATHITGRTRPTIIKAILAGQLGAERISGWYFVNREDVEKLARQRAECIDAAAVA